MDASSTVWIIAVIALIVGALIGYLMGRSGGSDSRQLDLIEQLDDTQRELADYKEKVTAHFEETANLVSNLTDSYKAVHQHLAKSSVELCSSEQASRTLEAAMQPRLSDSSEGDSATTADAAAPEQADASITAAPLDYAPKKPDEEGTLSEAFGLKEGAQQDAVKDPTDYAPREEKENTSKSA